MRTLSFFFHLGTSQWNAAPRIFKAALSIHNDIIRNLISSFDGYEVKTVGDSFMIAFVNPVNAVRFCLMAQLELLRAPWPEELFDNKDSRIETDSTGEMLFRGLRVRFGGAHGLPEVDFDKVAGE